ncbi:MAG: DegV family protein [Anaerolineae bacterium]
MTDSTCDLPADIVQKHQIGVIPTFINQGDRSLADNGRISPATSSTASFPNSTRCPPPRRCRPPRRRKSSCAASREPTICS